MSAFKTTSWSLVLAARGREQNASVALAELCRRYREPVLSYVRWLGYPVHEAEDMTQAFFIRLLERRIDAQADASRGRFRSFLLSSLRNFIADEHDAKKSAKRGGAIAHESIDATTQELRAHAASPEAAFERGFAFATIERAFAKLRSEAARGAKAEQFAAVADLLLEPERGGGLSERAQRLGVRANTLAVACSRWRARLADLIRAEIAETVSDPKAIDAELRALRDALRA